MNSSLPLLLAFAIGVVAGLRSMTAPAVVAWAARLGWLNLQGSPLAWIGSTVAVVVFTLGALAELVADQLPKTPARTKPIGLTARIVMGGLSGACLCAASGVHRPVRAVLGGIGGIVGAFAGYEHYGPRQVLRVPDPVIAGRKIWWRSGWLAAGFATLVWRERSRTGAPAALARSPTGTLACCWHLPGALGQGAPRPPPFLTLLTLHRPATAAISSRSVSARTSNFSLPVWSPTALGCVRLEKVSYPGGNLSSGISLYDVATGAVTIPQGSQ